MIIYKITDNTNGNVYYGKTIRTLKVRMVEHKSRGNRCVNQIIVNGDYTAEVVEENATNESERWWIENNKCINKIMPCRSRQERYEANKEHILKKCKKYRDDNIEKERERHRLYNHKARYGDKREETLEKAKIYAREYRKRIKEKKLSQLNL